MEPTSLKWKITLSDAGSCTFLQNSKKALVLRKDSLAIIDLSDDHAIHYMTNISDFNLVKYGANNDLLLYKLTTKPDELVVKDMQNGKEKRFSDVERYWSSAGGNTLVLETKRKQDSTSIRNLTWVDMSDGSIREMWKGGDVKNYYWMKRVFNAHLVQSELRMPGWRYGFTDGRTRWLKRLLMISLMA